MSTRNGYAGRNRDMQDGIERHTHQELTYEDGAGAIVKVKGNGTVDTDVYVLRIGGVWLHLPKGMNADVFLLAGGADTNQKHALTDIPRDKHRKTVAGTSGMQHPSNPDISVELSDEGVRVTGENFAVGKTGVLEVKDGKVYVRGDLTVSGAVNAGSVLTPTVNATSVTAASVTGAPSPTPGPDVPMPQTPTLQPVTPAPDAPTS